MDAARGVAGWGGLLALLVFAVLLSLGTGAVPIELADLVGLLVGDGLDERAARVLTGIRLPRVVLGLGVGGSLAVSGALLQALFRNPLASPQLLGLSTGAAFGAALAIVADLPGPLLPLSAFVSCMAATGLVLLLGNARNTLDLTSLLLGGIAVNAIAGAGTGLVIFLSDDAQLRALNFFTLGSLGGATWSSLWVSVPLIAFPLVAMPWLASPMNALMLGEAEAGHLGLRVGRLKLLIVCTVAAGVGACVSVSGMIGFVGLAVPHLVRLVAGPDNRIVLPASALVGAALLLAADTLARSLAAPAEVPIGILTTLLGGPFFVWLLLRRQV